MSREIRFRLWDEKNKEWTSSEFWIGDGYYLETEYEDWTGHKIIVEQYTGLKDKNGKEIYEGDILKCPWGEFAPNNYEIGFVFFHEGCFWLSPEIKNVGQVIPEFFGYPQTPVKRYNWPKAEIIGNIHENPELLKK